MRQAEAKYRAQRCMPFGSCKESGWEKEQRGEGGLEEEDYLFRQPGGDSRVPGTFTFRFKKILQEGDLPDNLNVHRCKSAGARTAKRDFGYLKTRFRQEQKARTAEAGRGDGVIEEKKNSPRNSKGCFGAPDWTRTSGLPGRRTVTDRFKWRNRAACR